MARVSIDELFEEQAQRNREMAEAQDRDPVWQAKEAARRGAEAAKIDAEIAAGLRDADGEWIVTDDQEDVCEDCGERCDLCECDADEEF
jgi:predicted transcriptional regulator